MRKNIKDSDEIKPIQAGKFHKQAEICYLIQAADFIKVKVLRLVGRLTAPTVVKSPAMATDTAFETTHYLKFNRLDMLGQTQYLP